MRTILLLLAASLAAGCGEPATLPSAEENRQLDAAEALLNDASNTLGPVDPGETVPGNAD